MPAIVFLKLMVAALLGALIGIEREMKGQASGLRTHTIVCLISAALMVAFIDFAPNPDSVARVAAAIMTGIGFLGAGNVISHGLHVRGLTTAASIWAVAGIGIVIGIEGYLVGVIATLIILVFLSHKRVDDVFIEKKKK